MNVPRRPPGWPTGPYGAILASPERMHEIGKAAEHLVCADIILQGHNVSVASAGLPYDVIADIGGRLYRIQVKSALRAKAPGKRDKRVCYSFNVRRRGKLGSRRLTDTECDLIALVALDIRVIAYLPLSQAAQTVQIIPPASDYEPNRRSWAARMDEFPLSLAIDPKSEYEDLEYSAKFCPSGHEYTKENTTFRLRGNGKIKRCRECDRVRSLANYYKRKQGMNDADDQA